MQLRCVCENGIWNRNIRVRVFQCDDDRNECVNARDMADESDFDVIDDHCDAHENSAFVHDRCIPVCFRNFGDHDLPDKNYIGVHVDVDIGVHVDVALGANDVHLADDADSVCFDLGNEIPSDAVVGDSEFEFPGPDDRDIGNSAPVDNGAEMQIPGNVALDYTPDIGADIPTHTSSSLRDRPFSPRWYYEEMFPL